MLRVAVTGGIGSGKSTVSARLAARGAVVIDSDRLAREVVAVGSPGLAAVAERFGAGVLAADGSLDRPALAAIVFADPDARRALEAITHPRVRARFDELAAAAPADAVVVNDIPLLVALPVAALFHLVIGVGADAEVRVQRLVGRGLTADDARARIAAQIDDTARRPLTDVWLDNDGSADDLAAAVDRLWDDRLVPFEQGLQRSVAAPRGGPVLVDPDPSWPAAAARLLARVRRAVGDAAIRLDHVGSTAVPGMPAEDVLDLQLVVADADTAGRLTPALAAAGFVASPGASADSPHPVEDDPDRWRTTLHANVDPGRAAHLHVRPVDGPAWRWALAFRDWLTVDAAERDAFRAVTEGLAAEHAGDADGCGYVAARQAWFGAAAAPLARWVAATGWTPAPP